MSEALTKSAGERETLGVRPFGRMNWIGLWTLYRKEVQRFWKVAFQTVAAPIITTLLYLTVFLVAFAGSDRNPEMEGQTILYAAFLPPGLIMMAILSNAFQNSSSSLIIAKVQGSVVDILMPPLSAAELTIAFVAGAATRGLLVGAVTAVTIAIFMAFTETRLEIRHLGAILYFSLAASIMMGAVGAIAGMWAEKFDQLALIANFVITPLTFLSGTFFSVNKPTLPDWVPFISEFNPLFYLIDGFRYGFIGVSDASVWQGVIVSVILNIALCYLTYRLFRSGYKLKA